MAKRKKNEDQREKLPGQEPLKDQDGLEDSGSKYSASNPWMRSTGEEGVIQYSTRNYYYHVNVRGESVLMLGIVSFPGFYNTTGCNGNGRKITEYHFSDGKPSRFWVNTESWSDRWLNEYQILPSDDDFAKYGLPSEFRLLSELVEKKEPVLAGAICEAISELEEHMIKRLSIDVIFPGSLSDLERMTGEQYIPLKEDDGRPVKIIVAADSPSECYGRLARIAYQRGADALVNTTLNPIERHHYASSPTSVAGFGYVVKKIQKDK